MNPKRNYACFCFCSNALISVQSRSWHFSCAMLKLTMQCSIIIHVCERALYARVMYVNVSVKTRHFFSSHYFVFIISKYFICICLVRGILDVFGCVCKMSNAFYTLLNVFYSSRKISIRYSSDHLMNPTAIAVENRIHNSHIHTGRDRHVEIQHIMT